MMIDSEPAIFFKITPVNPRGMTIVDLGEMPEDDVQPAPVARRYSSLPPVTGTRNSREGRYTSLPPPRTVTIISTSPSVEGSETDGETNSIGDSDSEPSLRKGDNRDMMTRVSCL
jgi:hypothetical protein